MNKKRCKALLGLVQLLPAVAAAVIALIFLLTFKYDDDKA